MLFLCFCKEIFEGSPIFWGGVFFSFSGRFRGKNEGEKRTLWKRNPIFLNGKNRKSPENKGSLKSREIRIVKKGVKIRLFHLFHRVIHRKGSDNPCFSTKKAGF